MTITTGMYTDTMQSAIGKYSVPGRGVMVFGGITDKFRRLVQALAQTPTEQGPVSLLEYRLGEEYLPPECQRIHFKLCRHLFQNNIR